MECVPIVVVCARHACQFKHQRQQPAGRVDEVAGYVKVLGEDEDQQNPNKASVEGVNSRKAPTSSQITRKKPLPHHKWCGRQALHSRHSRCNQRGPRSRRGWRNRPYFHIRHILWSYYKSHKLLAHSKTFQSHPHCDPTSSSVIAQGHTMGNLPKRLDLMKTPLLHPPI